MLPPQPNGAHTAPFSFAPLIHRHSSTGRKLSLPAWFIPLTPSSARIPPATKSEATPASSSLSKANQYKNSPSYVPIRPFKGLALTKSLPSLLIVPKLQIMPFLAVYCSVRATTQTNCILMLSSCLLWEIFRMIASSFCAG